jgi:hypothetical protein
MKLFTTWDGLIVISDLIVLLGMLCGIIPKWIIYIWAVLGLVMSIIVNLEKIYP